MPTISHKSPAPAQAERPLDARQAAESAFNYFRALVPNTLLRVSDPSLEEIEMSKDGRYWLITLGISESRRKNENLPKFLQVPLRRLKVFKVDAATGRVLSMKNPNGE
ncbi:MAG: hypothetical protein ABSH38_03775 [Verrucomicrobiota bacterium]